MSRVRCRVSCVCVLCCTLYVACIIHIRFGKGSLLREMNHSTLRKMNHGSFFILQLSLFFFFEKVCLVLLKNENEPTAFLERKLYRLSGRAKCPLLERKRGDWRCLARWWGWVRSIGRRLPRCCAELCCAEEALAWRQLPGGLLARCGGLLGTPGLAWAVGGRGGNCASRRHLLCGFWPPGGLGWLLALVTLMCTAFSGCG